MTVTIRFKGANLEVTGDYTPVTPARVNADPYDCYPEEGGTFDISGGITCGGEDVSELLEIYNDEIEELAADAASEQV